MPAFEEFHPTKIVLDIVMPEIDGLALVQWQKSRDCNAKVLFAPAHNPIYVNLLERIGLGLGISCISSSFALEELGEALTKPRSPAIDTTSALAPVVHPR